MGSDTRSLPRLTPNDEMPQNEFRVMIEPTGDLRTRMSIESRFPSRDSMEQLGRWAWRRV